ncbi:MAG: MBL fold metallo-hydrolase [Candidatus Marinimicrobia bacterium]|nr:MBL fold metallo-hydrolase [Candidatus Neomarinimicrobiota bacterium]
MSSLSVIQFLVGCSTLSRAVEGKPGHHMTEGFRNYPLIPGPSSSGNLSFLLRRFRGALFFPEVPPGHSMPEEKAIVQLNSLKKENSLTWLGHSTFLIRLNGKTILTDPFLTERASPITWAGPKRFIPPGISIKKLPAIDIIIVSHNHYDHLDEKTIESLHGKENIHIVVPLGLKTFFTQRGYPNVKELDWGENTWVDGIQMTSLPAVHFSGRGIGDWNKTLWCSWAIISSSGKYYFAGDTAYSYTIFRDIREKYKSFNFAIVPIGAYEPPEIMKTVHTTPEEAIRIGQDIRAKVMVASHWGTIELSDEPHWEPPRRFKKHAAKVGIPQEQIWVMKIGETRILP